MAIDYEEIFNREETEDFNDIDRCREILLSLLDDENVSICSEAGALIQRAADLIE